MAKSFLEIINKANPYHDPKTGRFTTALGGMSDSDGNKLSAGQSAYFANSKAVDADGNLVKVYHGTTNDFTVFDESYLSPESDMGAGIYLSNTKADSDANYGSTDGADLNNKIDSMTDRLVGEGMDYDEAKKVAEEMFITAEAQTMECYVNMTNPVYISKAPGIATTFEFNDGYDPETDTYGEASGRVVEFIDCFTDAVYSGKYDCWKADRFIEEVTEKICQDAIDYEGITAEECINIIKDKSWNYSPTASNRFGDGYFAAPEIARDTLERMGFDGIIDSTVSTKFNMDNMNYGTRHYIVFDSNQVKLTSNLNPTDNADITKGRGVRTHGLCFI